MSDAQTARIQRIRNNGGKIHKIAELPGGNVEIELAWGWLQICPDGHECSRLQRNAVALGGAA